MRIHLQIITDSLLHRPIHLSTYLRINPSIHPSIDLFVGASNRTLLDIRLFKCPTRLSPLGKGLHNWAQQRVKMGFEHQQGTLAQAE